MKLQGIRQEMIIKPVITLWIYYTEKLLWEVLFSGDTYNAVFNSLVPYQCGEGYLLDMDAASE